MFFKRLEAAILGFMYPLAGQAEEDAPALPAPEEEPVEGEPIIRQIEGSTPEFAARFEGSRREAAMGLMDDEVVSFVIIEARQGDDDSEFDLSIHGQVLAPYMSGIQGAVAEFLSSTHRSPGN